MKYVVQLSYTNPAHEHVSLRRRVDTVNRIVEAANENQAILRASQQQRALGFMIKEAKIVKEKEKMKKKEVVVDDNEKTEVAASGGMKEEVEQVDEGSKRMSAAVKLQRAFEREKTASDVSRKRGEEMLAQARAEYAKKQAAKTNENVEQVDEKAPPGAKYERMVKHIKKGYAKGGLTPNEKSIAYATAWKAYGKKEEVEQVDEANMRFDPEAAARPKSSDVKNFLNRDKNARAGAASKKYIRRMTKLGGLGPNQTKKDTEAHMKAHFEEVELSEASKEGKDVMRNMRASMKSMDLRHGVDSDKREAGYKMSPAVKAAQAKSDALSKVVKRPQAGTLAAAKMKTEAMDPNEAKGEQKIVKTSKKAAKAAEKMVNAAKGKMNKINIQPTMDIDVKSK